MLEVRRLATLLATLTLALAATACRGGDDGDDDDDAPDASVNPDDVSIYDIQGSLPVDGSSINVRGVVVTAIDNYGSRRGNIFVQEPDGGAYSGVLVYGADLEQVADLAVGDLVDIEGAVKDEFALTMDTSGRTTTELVPPEGGSISVVKVGDGTLPDAEAVDALAIGQLATQEARDDEWEKWEGVPITLANVSILTSLRDIDEADPTFVEFQVTGPMRVDSSLSALIDPATPGDCLASVTGIGDYFFNYKILPTSASAIVAGGSGCPVQEESEEACADSIDNEADGFADCADFSCQVLEACQTDTTIEDVQMGLVAPNTPVHIDAAFVTAIDATGSNQGFWAADALQAAPYNGVYVYTGSTLPAGLTIGATVEISATVDEFDLPVDPNPEPEGDTLTELDARAEGAVVVTAGAGVPLPVTGVAANTLRDIVAGEPYEGVLVQLSNMRVTATASGDRLTITNGSETIVVDDEAYNYAAADYTTTPATCFATITGVMTLNVFDDERRLAPTSAADMVTTGGSCP